MLARAATHVLPLLHYFITSAYKQQEALGGAKGKAVSADVDAEEEDGAAEATDDVSA